VGGVIYKKIAYFFQLALFKQIIDRNQPEILILNKILTVFMKTSKIIANICPES
jgi:hypothetical protein